MTLLNNLTLRHLTNYPCYAVCYRKFGSRILAARLEAEIQNALYQISLSWGCFSWGCFRSEGGSIPGWSEKVGRGL
jgi:hypothetical protein